LVALGLIEVAWACPDGRLEERGTAAEVGRLDTRLPPPPLGLVPPPPLGLVLLLLVGRPLTRADRPRDCAD
jgi:hypothetical protein